jgi:putative drug exporter of the RND superfamily
MFAQLSEFTRKYRIIIAAVWLAAAAILFLVAPKLSKVGVTDESQFLPQNTESTTANNLLQEKFVSPTPAAPSNVIIVIYDAKGLSDSDMQAAKDINTWLTSGAAPKIIQGVTSIYVNDALKATLISSDQTTMMMVVNFSVSGLDAAAKTGVRQIQSYITQNHPDLQAYLTGNTAIYQDMADSVQQTIDRTTIVTIILVAILLLIIYRSPIAIFLPLIAIGASFGVASGVISYLAQAGVKFSTLTQAYLVVIIFGVGTDYCLFLVSRFREELRRKERPEARASAITQIAPVIAASALTVIVAFLSMGISRFGMDRTMGYALAIGVGVTLLAGMTLVPALMSLFGKYLFWPGNPAAPKKEGRFGWHVIGDWVSRHPVRVAVPIVVVLLIPYAALPGLKRTADVMTQLPQKAESVKGFKILNAHFPAGELSPLYLLVESQQGNITGSTALQSINTLAQSLQSVKGVAGVDYYNAPVSQLTILAAQIRSIGDAVGQGSPDQLSSVEASAQVLQGLALQYPGILQSPNFQQAEANLAQVGAIGAQLATAAPAEIPSLSIPLQTAVYNLSYNFTGLVNEFNLQTSTPFTAFLEATYFSTDKTTARINIVLSDDPYSSTAVTDVGRIRKAMAAEIPATTLTGSASYLGGQSAVQADIMAVNDSDFLKVVGLAIFGILVVIIILLRSLLAPLYMVATVLLNYGTTLGLTTWVFLDLMKQGALIYMIPLFIFVILVALGADYNIFLVSRIREEAHQRPIKEAVSHAVANTGGVITACGIILAGTFATLMISPLQVVVQIGVAIASGVLVDTFIVRALLVPSLATLAGRWSWWPSGLFKKLRKHPEDR